ncbi:MAG: histidine phosphatase family protein [Clostridia bacterium]|nr:histidine phosphatase family protein [Clostridia bacterium]
MTTLIFVRHGQSQSNLEKRFTGQGETPLTALGQRQAQNTARFLKDYPIRAVYASDLSRAMDTARPTAELHGLSVIPTPALREVFAGNWEGKHYDELMREFPVTYAQWLQDLGHAWPDHGERVADLAARVYAQVDRLLERHRGSCIALFSHATPARMMGCRWQGVPPEEASSVKGCGNASVSVVEYDDNGSFRVLLYGYDAHQGEHATRLPGLLG